MPVDPRFFEPLGKLTVQQIADLTGAVVNGDGNKVITGVAPSEAARAGDICFFEGTEKDAAKLSPHAGACFVKERVADVLPETVTRLVVGMPRWSFVNASKAMFRLRSWTQKGTPPQIDPSAEIAPGAVVCDGAAIGPGSIIGPNAAIGPGVQIGANCRIGANVSILCALVGNGVTVLSGARIGESGFGVTVGPDGAVDVPQWGRVILQDDVLIGANTCVDRGAFDDTIIGERTKVDNLCQIGHNVVLGRDVMLASFAGLSGTVTVGDRVVMGGRVGITDHVNIGEGAQLAAGSGVFRDIPPGEAWGGLPARPLRQYLREIAWIQKQVAPKKKPTS